MSKNFMTFVNKYVKSNRTTHKKLVKWYYNINKANKLNWFWHWNINIRMSRKRLLVRGYESFWLNEHHFTLAWDGGQRESNGYHFA